MPLTAEDFELSAQDRANMSAFAAQYRGLGRGPLVVSMPTGGSNSQSAVTLAAQARTQMHAEGVPFEAITGGAYDASGRAAAPIIVSFRRFQAVVPDCGPPTENLARNPTNQPPANFGCALNASIAAQIADPGDIAAPHPTDPADTLRRQAVLDNYRGGARTSAAEGANATLSTTNAGQ
ncbi:MAG: CpaD family pilus assembly protein [Maricaulaceae bacterium]